MSRRRTITISPDMSIEVAEDYILREMQSIRLEDAVTLDMSRIRTVDIQNIPFLIILSYLSFKKTNQFIRLVNVTKELQNDLRRIGFWNLKYVSHREYLDRLGDKGSGGGSTVLPITVVENDAQLSDLFIRLRQEQAGDLTLELRGKLGRILNMLGENCLEHSGMKREESFYAFMEESEEEVVMIVLDMGEGFYHSLSKKYRTISSDKEAVSRVLEENISCREKGGGSGYFTIKQIINQYAGRIMIRSGDAIVHYRAGAIEHTEETVEKMMGCCVLVELRKDGKRMELW